MVDEANGTRRPRRGARIAIGLAGVVGLVATVGIVTSVLTPEPTGDPCATLPEELVDEFFEDSAPVAMRMSLPESSIQRCVWLARSDDPDSGGRETTERAADDPRTGPDYRRVEVVFGLADQDAYLDELRESWHPGSSDGSDGAAADDARADDAGNGPEDRRTVRTDQSADGTAVVRMGTVQPGRTESERDIVLELSAHAGSSGPDSEELDELLDSWSDELLPMQESALHDSQRSEERILGHNEPDTYTGRPGYPGIEVDPQACEHLPDDLLRDLFGDVEKGAAPGAEGGCAVGPDGRPGERDPEASNVGTNIRAGTAEDDLTARDAYADLTLGEEPYGLVAIDEYGPLDDEFPDGTHAKVLVGSSPIGARSGPGTRLAEVVAVSGRTVVAVQVTAVSRDGEDQLHPSDPAEAREPAMRLARTLTERWEAP